jgi:AraC-like DNA-binding protein
MITLPDLHVSMGGTDWPHEFGEVAERPNGFGEYLFLRFRTPMFVWTARGTERCKAGTCLIYAPGHRQWYHGDGVGFRDDWFHVSGSDVGPSIERAGLPVNTLFTPRSTSFFPVIVEEIRTELQRQEAFWESSVALAVARLVVLLGRGLREVGDRNQGVDVVRRERLRRVREHVHARLAERWTVAQMAKLSKLGANRFAVLYRDCFGISPMEDLIQARLHHAEWLLTNRHMSVGEAAEQSGFRSIHYFSRFFHRRVGCAPSDYHVAPRL